MADEATALCDLMSHADRGAKATYYQIKRDGRLLEEQYLFSNLYFQRSGNTFEENDIGLFATVDLCRQIEQEAFVHGIPVKSADF